MFHSFVYRRACVSHDLAVNTKGGLINCTGSVLLDAFPSCYSPVGHISYGRRCIAKFPCIHICQFSFNGEWTLFAFGLIDLWLMVKNVDVNVSFHCRWPNSEKYIGKHVSQLCL
jgi:hypothetical protein